MKRVVVTGLGMINALGLDKESAFSAILDGKCGIKNIDMSWILEDNRGIRNIIENIGGRVYKKYRIYGKNI